MSKISKLKQMEISFDYDIGGKGSLFNVAFDMWLTSKAAGKPGTIETEINIWTHVGNIDPAG
ncbi:MAG: hypothetical protein ACO1SX_15255, partial [Actinomycetota bacterium]